MSGRPYLHFVDRRPPEPRRLAVRITAAAGRGPFGRTRPFRLDEHALEELLRHAERLERGTRR